MKPITGIILTKNNVDMIENCLRSVLFLDEIIVVDDESTDGTTEIAKKFTPKILTRKLDNFSEQRNFALGHAQHDWVLFIDADERISKQLRQEIMSSDPSGHTAYQFLWRSVFLGKEMRYGGWQDEYHTRLLNKRNCHFVNPLHETLKCEGSTGTLPGTVFHFSHRSIQTNMYKTVKYAVIQSQEMLDSNFKKITRWNLLSAVLSHFFQRYIRQRGYRDGMEGFIEAMYQAFSQIFVIRTMLWERQRGKTPKHIYEQLDQKLLSNDFDEHAL